MHATRTFALTCAWLLAGCGGHPTVGISSKTNAGADAGPSAIAFNSQPDAATDAGTSTTVFNSQPDAGADAGTSTVVFNSQPDAGADAGTSTVVFNAEPGDPGTKVTLMASTQDQTEVAPLVAQQPMIAG